VTRGVDDVRSEHSGAAPAASSAGASAAGASGRAAPTGRARSKPLVIGVLSDTHGHLYPEVAKQLEGVDHIVHAGDIGSSEVLQALRRIAPVTAVRGNVDSGGWADALPSRAEVDLGGVRFVVAHIAPRPDSAGRAGQPVVVVAGHSHVAALEERSGVLHLNPGSAGPRRWGRPRTLARVEIWPGESGAAGARDKAAGPNAIGPNTAGDNAAGLPGRAPVYAIPRVTARIISVDGG
jgi:uncharacterized protein